MTDLDKDGLRLLELLVEMLPHVTPGRPNTYVTYKEVHLRLDLPLKGRYGKSLQIQGLNSLAGWAFENNLPAISGLIISKSTKRPGSGYFELYKKDEDDLSWWTKEIEDSQKRREEFQRYLSPLQESV
ncbi:hypothetical protein ACO2RV_23870 [Ancylobacter sp. VNQ12]|uniref:hypothetical protein n=1 Tax=Ancylobacter sp. VNQ12 TaxID=3400920 RepID=UPI003C0287C2